MSLGDGSEHHDSSDADCSSDPTSVAIAALHAARIAVFVAAGNDGHDDGVAAPGCTEEAISVGGVYDQNVGTIGWCQDASCSQILCTESTQSDRFVGHSNSDELLDLLAPDFRTGTTAVGGAIQNAFGGTSAASPYAAAQAALLLGFDPAFTPEDLRTLLTAHGPQVRNSENGLSFTRSDVQLALTAQTCGNAALEAHEECDPSAGSICCTAACAFETAGTACDDGMLCTLADICDTAGVCQGSTISCDDANPCTDDACDPGVRCVATPNALPCDDGNTCTSGDSCAASGCGPGAPVLCDDFNPCTDDTCNPPTECAFLPNPAPCDNSDACTSGDRCSAGFCGPGASTLCDDLNACTDAGCDGLEACFTLR
jgi:hypothetical protein